MFLDSPAATIHAAPSMSVLSLPLMATGHKSSTPRDQNGIKNLSNFMTPTHLHPSDNPYYDLNPVPVKNSPPDNHLRLAIHRSTDNIAPGPTSGRRHVHNYLLLTEHLSLRPWCGATTIISQEHVITTPYWEAQNSRINVDMRCDSSQMKSIHRSLGFVPSLSTNRGRSHAGTKRPGRGDVSTDINAPKRPARLCSGLPRSTRYL